MKMAEKKKKEEEKVLPKADAHPTDATKGSPGGATVEKKPEAKKSKKTIEEIEAEIKNLTIIKYPLITEKAVNMIEAENKLTFVVGRKTTKDTVKKSIEDLYNVKVDSVNIINDMKARKKAIVTINKKYKADNIATKLGVI